MPTDDVEPPDDGPIEFDEKSAWIASIFPYAHPNELHPMDAGSAALWKRRSEVVALWAKGATYREISAQTRYSISTISNDIRLVGRNYQSFAESSYNERIARELMRLARLESEAWDAWDRSKGEATKTTTGTRNGINNAQIERRQREGNPAFLKMLESLWVQRCKLLRLLSDNATALDTEGVPTKMVAGIDIRELV